MIYLWSDTHFNHRNIIKHCPTTRLFDSVEAMNEEIIQRWNRVIRPEDQIYHLGDFAFTRKGLPPAKEHFDRLNGEKHLLKGNHDEENKEVLQLGWASINSLLTLKSNAARAELCHYPIESWKRAHHGALMLHGHSHGGLKRKVAHRFDVGFDVFPSPVPFDHLVAVASTQTFEAADHHGDM